MAKRGKNTVHTEKSYWSTHLLIHSNTNFYLITNLNGQQFTSTNPLDFLLSNSVTLIHVLHRIIYLHIYTLLGMSVQLPIVITWQQISTYKHAAVVKMVILN